MFPDGGTTMRFHTSAPSGNAIMNATPHVHFSLSKALVRLLAILFLAAIATAAAAADAAPSADTPVLKAGATPEEKARFLAECAKVANEAAPVRPLVGDPARGAALPRGCFSCHGLERYVAPVTHATATFMDAVLRASGLSDMPPAEPARFKGRVTSLTELREGVTRRNAYLNPKLTPQEIEDVVAYLNVTYYKFPQ